MVREVYERTCVACRRIARLHNYSRGGCGYIKKRNRSVFDLVTALPFRARHIYFGALSVFFRARFFFFREFPGPSSRARLKTPLIKTACPRNFFSAFAMMILALSCITISKKNMDSIIAAVSWRSSPLCPESPSYHIDQQQQKKKRAGATLCWL